MHSARTSKAKTYILLCLMLILGPLGNTILNKGMKDIGELAVSSPAELWSGFISVVGSPTIWLGMMCLMGYLICYMLVLSIADYSFVTPFTGSTFILVPLFSFLWLHEEVSTARWIGIGFVLGGVLLISRTPHRTTPEPPAHSAPESGEPL